MNSPRHTGQTPVRRPSLPRREGRWVIGQNRQEKVNELIRLLAYTRINPKPIRYNMIITDDEWSDLVPVEYGKNIVIRFTSSSFLVKVVNAIGVSHEAYISGKGVKEHTIYAYEIKDIWHPVISFKNKTRGKSYIEFTLEQPRVY